MAIEKGRPSHFLTASSLSHLIRAARTKTKLGAKAPAGWSPYFTSEARRIFALYKTEGPRFHCSAELSRGKKLKALVPDFSSGTLGFSRSDGGFQFFRAPVASPLPC